jgi:hypothetical protein
MNRKPFTIRERFLAFYREFHKHVCFECYDLSIERLLISEAAWFMHETCADGYEYARKLFREEIVKRDLNLHA